MFFEIGLNWPTVALAILLFLALAKVLGFLRQVKEGWQYFGIAIRFFLLIILTILSILFILDKKDWLKYITKNKNDTT